MIGSVLAQAGGVQNAGPDSSSAAAAIFGVLLLVGILSLFVISKRGRNTVGPLIAVLIGASILAGTINDAWSANVSAITFISLFFGVLVTVGGLGALREGVAVPEVEGVEPDPRGRTHGVTPDEG